MPTKDQTANTDAYTYDMAYDLRFGTGSQRRESFLLYRRAMYERAKVLRKQHEYVDANILKHYAKSLQDQSPRDTSFSKHEWKLISRALRLNNCTPSPGYQQRLYSVYQWVRRHMKEAEGK